MLRDKIFSFSIKIGKDIIYEYFSGTGKGGQHRNKHKNCVRVKHPQSGVIVQSTEERSRTRNEKIALKRLTEHPKFKLWLRAECSAKLKGYSNLVAEVDDSMREENLKIEYIGEKNE